MTEHERLIVAGREVAISNPDKVLFPQAGYTKLDLVRYYLAVADGALRGAGGRPNVLVRYPNGIGGEFFYQKRAPESRPPWIEVVALQLSVRPHRRRSRAARRRRARLDGQPRLPRAASASGARRRSRSSRRAARRSRSGAGRRVAAVREVARVVQRDARRLRARRLAEDVGLARHARLRAHRAALDVRRGAPRRAGVRARGRAARARPGDEQVVEGRAPRRLPRLQPEREGPHDRRRLLGAADARRARVGAARLGRDRRLRAGRLHAGDDAGAVRARSAIAMPASTSSAGRSSALLELSARQEREGQGDAPWPPHYRKQPGEPPRVQPSRRRVVERTRSSRSDAPREKEDALAGLERWKARHPEAAAHLAAGRRPRRRDARPLSHLDAHPRQPAARAGELRPAQEALDPDDAPNDWEGVSPDGAPRRRPSRARKAS